MTLDPEGPLSLLLRAGGTAWFLLTVVIIVLALLVWIWARTTRRESLSRLASRAGTGVVAVYAISWRGTIGWLIPGPENVLVQRKTQIRLPVETVSQ